MHVQLILMFQYFSIELSIPQLHGIYGEACCLLGQEEQRINNSFERHVYK